jgi:hypothetical protein
MMRVLILALICVVILLGAAGFTGQLWPTLLVEEVTVDQIGTEASEARLREVRAAARNEKCTALGPCFVLANPCPASCPSQYCWTMNLNGNTTHTCRANEGTSCYLIRKTPCAMVSTTCVLTPTGCACSNPAAPVGVGSYLIC